MANVNLRRAEATDAATLAACIDAAYAAHAARIADMPAVSEGIAADIEDNYVWVAEQGGRIVGGIILVVRDDHGVLANVAVAPDARGTGLGRRLIDRVETAARGLGLAKLRLSTHPALHENVRLYERLGWRETARSDSKVTMEKCLAA